MARSKLPDSAKDLASRIVEASAVRDRAILEQRAVARRVVLEELRVFAERDTEGGDGFFVALVAKVGVAEVAVEDRHVVAEFDGLLVGLDGFAETLALIPDGADVVGGVGVVGVGLQ